MKNIDDVIRFVNWFCRTYHIAEHDIEDIRQEAILAFLATGDEKRVKQEISRYVRKENSWNKRRRNLREENI